MVCPMCITAVVSQAAVPVASAVGGAIAVRTALNSKKRGNVLEARKAISVRADDRSPQPVLQALDVEDCNSRRLKDGSS
jgi:hypothetical protein